MELTEEILDSSFFSIGGEGIPFLPKSRDEIGLVSPSYIVPISLYAVL
jgi:hypothetical protein